MSSCYCVLRANSTDFIYKGHFASHKAYKVCENTCIKFSVALEDLHTLKTNPDDIGIMGNEMDPVFSEFLSA